MDDAGSRSILKRGAKRTLWVRAGHGSHGEVVVKRFHAPGLLDRWRDGARAEGERRALATLRARGLPVPEPLSVERNAGGVDLVMSRVEDAEPLRAVAPRSAGSKSLAREIGSLLARAALCGLRHPDLHAGNVLVDRAGRAWLVDLHGARIGGRFDWKEHAEALVVLEADMRETTRPRDRARALVACLRELRRARCAGVPAARDVARAVDAAARLRRRDVVERSSRRWLRSSSVTVAYGTGFRARDASEELCRSALGGYATGRLHIVERVPARTVRARWRTAARLLEHGIPAARPLAIELAPRTRAVLDAAPAADTRSIEADPRLRRRAAASLGTLLGLLEDRALALAGPLESAVAFDSDGNARVAVGARLRAGGPRTWLAPVRALASAASPVERARFVVAFLRTQQRPARELAELRARLRGGVERA